MVSDWHGRPRWLARPMLRQRATRRTQVDRVALEFGERPERAGRASARVATDRPLAEAARLAQQALPEVARRASARSEADRQNQLGRTRVLAANPAHVKRIHSVAHVPARQQGLTPVSA